MKERIDHSQEYISNIYEKSADSLARDTLAKFKAVRAKNEAFSEDLWQELLYGAKEGLQRQLNFSPDLSRLDYLTLEKLLAWRSQEPRLNEVGAKFFMDKYLVTFKDKLISDAIASGMDFYSLLGQRLKEIESRGVELDNQVINELKKDWADEYHIRLDRDS